MPIVYVIALIGLLTGCASGQHATFASYGVSTQPEAAALVFAWKREARALWQQVDMLELEAQMLGRQRLASEKEAARQKQQAARELRISADQLADRANELQRLLPPRILN